jgi:uncharacterized membrane protein HdeD (DUF308 family)
MGALSFDVGIISGLACLADMSFYGSLLCSTLGLVLLVASILIGSTVLGRRTNDHDIANKYWSDGIFVCVYVLLFAYPTVSVKVVETFAW